MKAVIVFSLFLLANMVVNAQYYYQDIILTGQTNQLYKKLISLDTRKISAVSFEADETPSKDFELLQTISSDAKEIFTRTATINSDVSFFIGSYNSGRISHTIDSSKNATNEVNYFYDGNGKIISIVSTSRDFDGSYVITELHSWHYNDKGQPDTMWKIKNVRDTTTVTFAYDESGNVSEEFSTKKGRTLETYHYYYNKDKHLTDIVRYNTKAGKLIPDFMFDYDSEGRISQMTQTQGGIANYLVWKYTYNTNGLKQMETVYNKKREKLGRIEYTYK